MLEIKIISLVFSVFTPLSWLIAMLSSRMYRSTFKLHLILLLAVVSFVHIMTYAKYQGHLDFYIGLFPIQALFVNLIFPLFYLYIYTITSEKINFKKNYIIHYILPIILFSLYFFLSKIWMSAEEEKQLMLGFLNGNIPDGIKYKAGYYLLNFGRIYYLVSSIFYVILIARCYSKFKVRASNIFSSDYTKELNWVKGIGLLMFLILIINFYLNRMHNQDIINQDLLLSTSYFSFGIFFWVLGYYGFRQGELYNQVKVAKTEDYNEPVRIEKKEIEEYLVKNKEFLNPNLSIYDLCVAFKTNRTYLSLEINKHFEMNFRTLINSYRIEEAVRIISHAKEQKESPSFEQIATETGFNSYSSFLRGFKIKEDLSPSEFYKKA